MVLALQKNAVYGPVCSRRLGYSLGVNVLSSSCKTCTLDCVYCQYGRAPSVEYGAPGLSFRDAGEVLRELEAALSGARFTPDHITLSGNGEPTLHPRLLEIVDGMTRLRSQYAPQARTALLTNSTPVVFDEVREAARRLDRPIFKIDCGGQEAFERYNRPAPGIRLEKIIEALAGMENVTIQTLFAGGGDGNLDDRDVAAWFDAIRRVSPVFVQIYTLDRPHSKAALRPARADRLAAIRDKLRVSGIAAEVY